jgi:regulatory protein
MVFSPKPQGPKTPRPAGKPPDEARLRDAALAHLAKFATTEAGLAGVLGNRVRRWARAAEAEGQDTEAALTEGLAAAKRVAAAMVTLGAVDDAGFAAARARRLARSGRSRRAMAAHLASKGIDAEDARAAMAEAPAEADAALALCRKRRIGPFARDAAEPALRLKWLGILARGGFSREVAEAALDAAPDEAEARLIAMRR